MDEELKERLDAIEAEMIRQNELRQFGHRILYDVNTGMSENIGGCSIDPRLLDEHGVQVRFVPRKS